MSITLAQASSIVEATLKKAREHKQMPQTVVVLDNGGHVICAKREDGSGIIRFEIAVGKAYGALGMGWGSRTMMERAAQNPNFLTAIVAASGGRLVPNPGGVLIRDAGNQILGAVGISGDTGDNDEIIAVAGIEAAGLKADAGGSKK
ncbi:MAG: heme-binding protein [Pseudolabrys sp.]